MKRKGVLLGLLFSLIFTSVTAQDVDIFKREKNDNFDFPSRPAQMTFEEYELLSTEIRMQDIMAAALVPGYIHFLIKEKKKGWYLVGFRAVGYAGVVYLAVNDKSIINILFNPLDKYTNKDHAQNLIVAYFSAAMIAGSFAYDWIHGRYLLHHKQNKIRFKYSPVVGLAPAPGGFTPVWGVSLRF